MVSVAGAAGSMGLPGGSAAVLQPDPARLHLICGLRGVDANAKLLARRHAARSFIGGAAPGVAAALHAVGLGSERDQVETQQFPEHGLKLVDFNVQFEEQRCFGMRIKIAVGHSRVEVNRLPVDPGQFVRIKVAMGQARFFDSVDASRNLLQFFGKPLGGCSRYELSQPIDLRVNEYKTVGEEATVLWIDP